MLSNASSDYNLQLSVGVCSCSIIFTTITHQLLKVAIIIQVNWLLTVTLLMAQLMSDNTILRSSFQEAYTPFIQTNGVSKPLAASQ